MDAERRAGGLARACWALWGKTRQGGAAGDETHALIHHMVEVGAVAGALWQGAIAPAVRADICRWLGLTVEEARRLLEWLAALHDIGKASPAFQAKHAPAIARLQAEGLTIEPQGSVATPHGTISQHVLTQELPRRLGAPPSLVRRLAAVIGGHHGMWLASPPDIPGWELGGQPWDAVRRSLADALAELFSPPARCQWPAPEVECNAFLVVLAGLITTADWIGSMAEVFPCHRGPSDPDEYLERARAGAAEAVRLVMPGELPVADGEELFGRLFPSFPPNSMQQATIELASELARPALVLIEAPTGCGKTEAALFLAEYLRAKGGGPGTYIGMPTMTTSNQMHDRVSAALQLAYPRLPVRPLLVHGQAMWRAPAPEVAPEADGAGDSDPMAWFLPRKRSLLAPFGVGTVDQALLGVLAARHFYLRLYGLAHKTVVFDEVHAYDTYMSTVFERLLAWLHALGSSVVILSATLPARTRRRLLDAFGPPAAGQADAGESYPAIWWKSGGREGAVPLPAGDPRDVRLSWLAREAMVEHLRGVLREGGCAAVICNTVGRAQATYDALKGAKLVPDDELYLFHARYPRAWREEIERRVLDRFGKSRHRRAGECAILVATQVVEQSLDLDFDYMLSDLAPVDLLIQRAGRLHRHARATDERPSLLQQPRLGIVREAPDDILCVRDDGPMYEPYLLLRTLLALEGRESLRTPDDTAALIAAVYDDEAEPELSGRPEVREALQQARAAREHSMRTAVEEAKQRLVASPQSRYFVGGQEVSLHDDDPGVHRSLQALTRLAEPSVDVVCVERTGDGLQPVAGGAPWAESARLDDRMARALAESCVTVTHRGALPALLAQAPPASWARHPFLRHCRLAVFVDGLCPLPGGRYTLRLSRELGLQVTKEVS